MTSMLDRKLLRDIWRLKGQVVAITLVVACGIATYIMAVSTLDSLAAARDVYFERYRLADVFASAKRAPMMLQERLRNIDGVATAYPRIRFGVTLDVEGLAEPATGLLMSVPDNGEPPLNAVYLRRGRLLLPGETDAVLVSEAFAEAHGFLPGDQLKAVINGRKRSLTIVGIALSPEFVYSLPPGAIMPDDKRYGILWMNRRALEAAVDLDGAFNDLVLSVMPGSSVDRVMDEVDRLLAPYGGLDAYPLKDQISYWFVQNELNQLNTMAVVLPAIFLSVAAFLLNIVLARQIITEREQIGMMKALGITNRVVGLHYMKFAIIIVMLGAVLGTLLGIQLGEGMTKTYTLYFRFPLLAYVFDPRTLVIGTAISVAAAVLGTQGAVRHVISLPPAEAMMPAPPVNYRPMLLEWLRLERVLSQPARMIARHLERRPGRALLSVIGVALSVSIFVVAVFPLDSIRHMIDVQYNIANREDVNLTFVEPKGIRALDEVLALPGVLAAEPYRNVSVRLRHGSLVHRTAITGLIPGSNLKRIIDQDLQPVALPGQGLMLSDKLAEILDLSVGEYVTIEVLEGRKPVLEVIVSGTVREYVGVGAFMRLAALNNLMDEPATMSGAALLTDKGGSLALFRQVKRTPQISGTLLKEVAINSFEETMAKTILQMTFFITIFAGMIAFGVVYNTARISLSERARELASMRVLGFTNREVAYVLLGELTLVVLVALPAGMAIGYGLSSALAQSMDTELFRLPVVISARTYGAATAVVLVASLLSAYIVWRRILRLDIVAVLKTRE